MSTVTLFGKEYNVHPDELTMSGPKDEKIILFADEDGRAFVYLDDHGVRRKIEFGLIILFLNHAFFLPFDYWERIHVGFLDDNVGNFELENLYLEYPEEPIEHEPMNGFYYIPGFELNCINEKGVIFRIPQSDIIFPNVEKNEKYAGLIYPSYRININNGLISTRYVHRLLGLTFKNPPKNYPLLSIDHIDGDKSNFELDNLEWVTSSENNIRAFENNIRTDNKVVLSKDLTTGEIRTFYSQAELSRVMGFNQGTISSYLTRGGVYGKRFVFKEATDERSWEEISGTNELSFDIKARHVITGETIQVTGINKAIKLFKSSSPAIIKQLNDKRVPRKILNGYEVKLSSDHSPWKEFSEHELHIYSCGMPSETPVFEITDLENNETSVIYGIKEALQLTGVVKRTLIVVAKRGGVIAGKYKVIKLK